MIARFRNVLALALLLSLVVFIPVFAGGWAVITLDELPGNVEANQPLEIGFMVRQHGVTPMENLSPRISAQLTGSKESVEVMAVEEGEVGHYVATLTLPQTGEWQWSIAAFTVNQPMPALTVVEATVAAPKSEPAPVSSNTKTLPLVAGGIGLLGALGGLLALQKKVRWAAAFVMIGVLVSGVGFVSAANQPEPAVVNEPQPEIAAVSSISQVELGRNLFIAKGCMMCHSHSETNKIREFGIDGGPDLTNLTANPDYLRLWLKDPKAAKSTATMPNLELKETEIEALIAFINAD